MANCVAPVGAWFGFGNVIWRGVQAFAFAGFCGITHPWLILGRCFRAPFRRLAQAVNQVFLVFVNRDKVAYSWRWARADKADDRLPHNHEERFERRAL